MAVRGLRIQAVLLDALGTLVELQPPAPRLRAELSSRFGLEVDVAAAERAIAAEIAYYRSHLDEGRDDASLAALRSSCAEILTRELGRELGADVPAGQEMVETLLASLSFQAFADVPPALAELRGLGLRLVVVSNWDASLPAVLSRLGLAAQLDGVVTSAEVGARKPAPAIFERGLALAGADPEQALHVGDSLREDIQGAVRAGIEAVLISRRPPAAGERSPGTIGSLLELPALLSTDDGRGNADG